MWSRKHLDEPLKRLVYGQLHQVPFLSVTAGLNLFVKSHEIGQAHCRLFVVQVFFDERRNQLDCLLGLDGFAGEKIENWLAPLHLLKLLVAVALSLDLLIEFFELVKKDVELMLSRSYVVLLGFFLLLSRWSEIVDDHVEKTAGLSVAADEGAVPGRPDALYVFALHPPLLWLLGHEAKLGDVAAVFGP